VGVDRVPPSFPVTYEHVTLDLGNDAAPKRLASLGAFDAVLHLAARAEVVVSPEELPELWRTNVVGTMNVLAGVSAGVVVFASSCAVYGNVQGALAQPRWSSVRPLGAYGMSKAAGEMASRDWARGTARRVVTFRFGNVIGAGCRGLIPYLVAHAARRADGRVPAQLRGRGRIVRDYVPVEYVVGIMVNAAVRSWPAGSYTAFNLGTGRGLTNRHIARLVQRSLAERGYALTFRWDAPLARGEARRAVVDPSRTVRFFEAPQPTAVEVRRAVERAVDEGLAAWGRQAEATTARRVGSA
jgi:nucleoside-diphosphate-sugar epimerase